MIVNTVIIICLYLNIKENFTKV